MFSCEETGLFIICSDCIAEEPMEAKLEIKIRNTGGSPVILRIYEGNLEENILFGSYQTVEEIFEVMVPLNKKYTSTATYKIAGKTYIAVDAATPKIKYDKIQCENPCYFVYDKIMDLRFKDFK